MLVCAHLLNFPPLNALFKPFTATALMVLVERRKIDLNRPIKDYLGDAKLRLAKDAL
jgi:CubicO group peptidase (beta-lactamase class C family)